MVVRFWQGNPEENGLHKIQNKRGKKNNHMRIIPLSKGGNGIPI